VLLALELWRSHVAATEEAEHAVLNLTQVLSEQTARTFQSVDLTLQSVVSEIEANPNVADNDADFRAGLHRRLRALPFVRALFVIGADGLISHDTDYPVTPRVSLADRPYFAAHRANPSLGLHIGQALKSRSTGTWFISLSRRIEREGGGFGGIAVAAVEPLYFENFYRQLWLGEGVIALFQSDGVLLARSPRREDAMGNSFASMEPFHSQLRQSLHGFIWTTSSVEGAERITGYRVLDDLPIVVLVALDEAWVMRPWRSHATALVVGGAILLIVLGLMEWLSRRYRRREELARRKLEESQRLETVGRFAGGIAHDLGNLLRIIRSAILLLRPATSDRPAASKLLDEVDLSLEAGRDLVNRLLSFSRNEEFRPEAVKLSTVITSGMPMFRQAAGPRIDVTTALELSDEACLIDVAQFQAAIVNLILNSRDAMKTGGTIRIHLRRSHEQNQHWIQVCVSDDGPGMPADVLEQALDPLFTTKKPGEGNGLGLNQVVNFVTRSSGRINLSSTEGQGTTVCLHFPFPDTHEPGGTEERSVAYPAYGEAGEGVTIASQVNHVQTIAQDPDSR
jgi:signal transduction histidine kinase